MLSKFLASAAYRPAGSFSERWILEADTTYGDFGTAIAVDGDGNFYIGGYTNYPQYAVVVPRMVVIKVNKYGAVQWLRRVQNVPYIQGLACDLSNNIYGVSSGFGTNYIFSMTSSGSFRWQQSVPSAVTDLRDVTVDSSGNTYVCGRFDHQGLLLKYNASGVLQWQVTLNYAYSSSSRPEEFTKLTPDTNGNIYVAGKYYKDSVYGTAAVLAKYNSSGTLQWQRYLDSASTYQDYFNCVSTSIISGDVVAAGKTSTGLAVARYESNGTLKWSRRVTDGTLTPSAVKILPATTLVLATQNPVTSPYDSNIVIFAFNNRGGFLWQRRLKTTGYDSGAGLTATNGVLYYIVGNRDVYPNKNIIAASLPADGSLIGAYGDFTYEATSYTVEPYTWDTGIAPMATGTSSLSSSSVSSGTEAVTISTSLISF